MRKNTSSHPFTPLSCKRMRKHQIEDDSSTMAGNLAALNDYLDGTLNISIQATQDALIIQGLDSTDAFRQLTDQDIKDLCDACRKPGGTIVNPNAAAPNAPAHIPNPGVALSFVSMKRLRMLRYYVHHMERIQRTFQFNQATMQ